MVIYRYDKTFEGLLTAVFEAYERKLFPDLLLGEKESLPLFYDTLINVYTDDSRSERVWKGLKTKLSRPALSCLTLAWMAELPRTDRLLFRYIRKAFDSPVSIELNFGDPDVLDLTKIGRKVNQEKHRVLQFARFQKTRDDIFFCPFEPLYNVLPLTLTHFQDRFTGQKWMIYDLKRDYGYYYDLHTVTEIHFPEKHPFLSTGKLTESQLSSDEKLFQKLWQEYFKSLTIKERINPRLHRQNMPARFWKYLTEKQG